MIWLEGGEGGGVVKNGNGDDLIYKNFGFDPPTFSLRGPPFRPFPSPSPPSHPSIQLPTSSTHSFHHPKKKKKFRSVLLEKRGWDGKKTGCFMTGRGVMLRRPGG